MNIMLSKLFIIDLAPFIVVTIVSTQGSSSNVQNGLGPGRRLSKSTTQKIQHSEHILRKGKRLSDIYKVKAVKCGRIQFPVQLLLSLSSFPCPNVKPQDKSVRWAFR